jgi:hypothetical protein
VYSPLEEIVPHVAPLQLVPDAVQVTAVFDVPVTEATNCCVAPIVVDALLGVTATATPDAAAPVPARPITIVPLVDELLVIVS